MQVSVLASGSKGNCTFIEMEGSRLLVDAGISARRIKQELSNIGQAIEELDGVFITHEHSDHIKGLATLTKKYGIPVYSRPETFRAMNCYRDIRRFSAYPHHGLLPISLLWLIPALCADCCPQSPYQ